jgi:Cu/Ag efflux protein CusF
MINIQNETHVAAPRNFRLLGFVFLMLALSFGSLAANAAQQENADKTPCRITGINAKTGVVSASVIEGSPAGGVQSFRFFVKDAALRSSLKEGQEIFADFNTQEVFTSQGASGRSVRLGGILTDYYGKNLGGPAGGGGMGGGNMGGGIGGGVQSQAGSPCGPPSNVGGVDMGGGGQSQAGPPSQPGGGMGGGNMGGGIGGGVQSQAGSPCGPPLQSGGVGDTLAGQNLGNGANPGQPNCQITNIDAATGIVRAKDLSTGQEFQFRVKDPAQLRSLHVGQSFFANLDSRQVSFDGKSFSGIQSFSFFNAGARD